MGSKAYSSNILEEKGCSQFKPIPKPAIKGFELKNIFPPFSRNSALSLLSIWKTDFNFKVFLKRELMNEPIAGTNQATILTLVQGLFC